MLDRAQSVAMGGCESDSNSISRINLTGLQNNTTRAEDSVRARADERTPGAEGVKPGMRKYKMDKALLGCLTKVAYRFNTMASNCVDIQHNQIHVLVRDEVSTMINPVVQSILAIQESLRSIEKR